ncbi:hypothetical protein Bbelb_054090 [Branchiostoma belcheri]|nr:hypothetical protein Bbelb_054090 [Branchiostoma belcheri]
MGARSSLLPWVCSFVSSRRQRVRYQHALSHWESLTCGVAEGTLLDPLLFLVMINDAGTTNSEYWKYVDDLNMGESRLAYSPSTLQNDLDSLDDWSVRNHMLLNPRKCKVLHISFMQRPPPVPALTLGGQVLTVVTQARLLGLQIQSDLGWDAQVDSMVTKGSRRLFLLCRLRRAGLPTVDLTTVYCGYVRPLLEYAAPTQSLPELCEKGWFPPTRGDPYGRQLRNSLQYSQARRTKRYTTSAKPMLAKLTSHTEVALQRLVSRLGDACKEFGLTISLKKPNIMGQDVSSLPNKSIGDYTLEVVGDFTYLGSTITRNLSLDVEVDKRIGKAATVMARLAKTV